MTSTEDNPNGQNIVLKAWNIQCFLVHEQGQEIFSVAVFFWEILYLELVLGGYFLKEKNCIWKVNKKQIMFLKKTPLVNREKMKFD